MAPPDPYLYPGSRVLRNKIGIRDQVALDEAEGDLVFAALTELLDHPPQPTGDLAELQAIHRYLFEDLYDWAGQLRTIDMYKRLPGGEESESFHPWAKIEQGAAMAVRQLYEDNNLRGMAREQFIERLAHHYDQVNYVHPFREGNGRTQRVFWNRVAFDAGWELDWTPVLGVVNDQASRVAAEDNNLAPLCEMFDQIVTPGRRRRTQAWRPAERARLGFPIQVSGTQAAD